jgi:hypothetical protein
MDKFAINYTKDIFNDPENITGKMKYKGVFL